MNKKELSERDIENIYITPAVINAGWELHSQIRQNVTLTPGPVIVRGEMSARNNKKKKFADYVLSWKPGTRVAVIEAKENSYTVSSGMQQALGYADILGLPSAFSSNGDAFACHNKVSVFVLTCLKMMSKKATQSEFVKWFAPTLDALSLPG